MPVIDRVPRSADEEAALLRSRPDGWELLQFAAVLKRKLDKLEPTYHDHEIRYVRPQGSPLNEYEAIAMLRRAFSTGAKLTSNAERVLAPDATERAFGSLGEPGDPARIDHLADRLIDIYEEFLNWAAALRGASVPDEFNHALDIASRFLDGPIRQVRAFVVDLVENADPIPRKLALGEPVKLEMTLKLEIEDGLEEKLHDELVRLEGHFSCA